MQSLLLITLLVFELVEQVIFYEDNTPSMIVPRTFSCWNAVGNDQIINKIEEEEEITLMSVEQNLKN